MKTANTRVVRLSRFGAFFAALALVVNTAEAAGYDFTDAYSSATEREAWFEQLSQESTTPPKVVWTPIGTLGGAALRTPLANEQVKTLKNWIVAHRAMLGFTPQAKVVLQASEPRYASNEHFVDVAAAQVANRYTFSGTLFERGIDPLRVELTVAVEDGQTFLIGVANSITKPEFNSISNDTPTIDAYTCAVLAAQFLGEDLEAYLDGALLWSAPEWSLYRTPAPLRLFRLMEIKVKSGKIWSVSVDVVSGTVSIPSDVATYRFMGRVVSSYPNTSLDGNRLTGPFLWQEIYPSAPTGPCVSAPGVAPCEGARVVDTQGVATGFPFVSGLWYSRSSICNRSPESSEPNAVAPMWPFSPEPLYPDRCRTSAGTTGLDKGVYNVVTEADWNNYPQCGPACAVGGIFYLDEGASRTGLIGHENGHFVLRNLGAWDASHSLTRTSSGVTEFLCDEFGLYGKNAQLAWATTPSFLIDSPSTQILWTATPQTWPPPPPSTGPRPTCPPAT